MKIIALIQQAIHNYKNPSDEKLLSKAYKIYHHFSSYHTYQHTLAGYEAAVKNKNEMFARLNELHSMKADEGRTQKIKDTIVEFKKINKIGFR